MKDLQCRKEEEGSSRNMCKGPMDKPKGGRIVGGRWAWVGWSKVVAGKWKRLYLKTIKKKERLYRQKGRETGELY